MTIIEATFNVSAVADTLKRTDIELVALFVINIPAMMVYHNVAARELVCVVTEMTTQRDQYPPGYCSHLVYSDVVFDPKHRKFLATKNGKCGPHLASDIKIL